MKLLALAAAAGLTSTVVARASEPPAPEAAEATAETPIAALAEKEGAEANEETSRFHLTLGADITTAYFFRGMNQEDTGFILQPYADASVDILRSEGAKLAVNFGTWNSFHSQETGTDEGDSLVKTWYEDDLYAGLGLELGKWSFDARYYFYLSPSNAFDTVEEFDLTIGLDDSEWLGAWAMNPGVLLAVETGSQASDGRQPGTYLQLGVTPGFSVDAGAVKGIEVTFPAMVGLSLSNYYQGQEGQNDAFGFAGVGAKAEIPLGSGDSFGEWKLSAGLQLLYLGDAAASLNEHDDTQVIGTVGVSVTF